MAGAQTLVLAAADVERTLPLADCIDAVESAFRDLAGGRLAVPPVVHLPGDGGGFHVKSAAGLDGRRHVAVKINGNFPDNPRRAGLPTIQGTIVLCDGRDGSPLAIMDSIAVTALRTAAATAVAAKYLAPPTASVATVVGCGIQGRVQLRALLEVRPITTVFAIDSDTGRRASFVAEFAAGTGVDVRAADNLAAATRASQVIVTCTPSRRPFLGLKQVSPGSFVAAVGADAADKQELEPGLLAGARVVVDILEQCAAFGELHHALDAGVMSCEDVTADLAALVAGITEVNPSAEDIVVFDSTGSAVQDLAAASLVYERASRMGSGTRVALA